LESLAFLVFGIFAAQALLGAATLTYAILNRRNGKFRVTSHILIGLLAIQMLWGFSVTTAFGYFSLFFLVPAVLVRYLKARD
jgi:hypothetical protein